MVRAKVAELLERKGDAAPFGDGDSLLFSGRLDSLNVLELVGYLETAFSLAMADQSLDLEAFDTVEEMVRMVGEA
jgi:acyl carrier protein